MLIDRPLRRHTAYLALLLGLSPVFATAATTDKEPAVYHLEIVLFRSTNPQTAASELWPDVFGTANVDRLIYVSPPDLATATPATPVAAPGTKDATKKPATPPGSQFFRFLGQKDFKLSSTVAKLARMPNHEVMLHTAWRQPAIDLQENAAVYVFDGMLFPEHPLDGSFSPVAAVPVGEEPESPEFNPPRFSGTVKLAVGRYLHVNMDMLLRGITQRNESVDAEGNSVELPHGAIQGYRLNEMRRIKIGEVHYFDHPAFGALVLVAATEKKGNTNVEKETVGDAPIPTATPDD